MIASGSTSRCTFYITANGSNWESVPLGSLNTITNTGSDVRWKIIKTSDESGGAIATPIKTLQIKYY